MRHKLSRTERRADNNQRREEATRGTGSYVYENGTKAEIILPRPTASGKRTVKPGERFQADSYFKCLVGQGLRLIGDTVPNTNRPVGEGVLVENKLILDQPNKVTAQGTVEHITKDAVLTEEQPKKTPAEVLITEDPMDGVEIILG